MIDDIEVLTREVKSHLGEKRFFHSLCVAKAAEQLAGRYGGDKKRAYLAGLTHDILKEQTKEEALSFFESRHIPLTPVEQSAPKLWHAMAGAVYVRENFGFDGELCNDIRYHTTGHENMTLSEKILFIADFISEDRNYNGVEEMRKRAAVSLESAMTEGLRFTVNELSELCSPIHPDTVACYNQTILAERK